MLLLNIDWARKTEYINKKALKRSVMQKILKRCLFFILPLLSYLFYELAFLNPALTEKLYSRGIYPLISKLFAFFTRELPFSLGEMLLYTFIVFSICFVVFIIIKLIKEKSFSEKTKAFVFNIQTYAIICAFLYSFFVLFWSIGFARLPLAQSMGYETRMYSKEELYELTLELVIRANELREELPEDESGVFKYSRDKAEVKALAERIYRENAMDFMALGPKSNIKNNTVKNLLSAINSQGIYSPFTFESNINIDMPDLYFGSTCCHEYSHLQGFCREDEAEFISFYVTYNCGDEEFMYSGTLSALVHALNSLYGSDIDLFREARMLVSDKINRDLAAYSLYWDEFETKVSESSEKLNDNYLKANHQEHGVKSYGRMLDLTLAMFLDGDL